MFGLHRYRKRQQIFKPFQRLHAGSTYEVQGMRLTIYKKIIERHNGEISVESSSRDGTVFHVIVSIKQPN